MVAEKLDAAPATIRSEAAVPVATPVRVRLWPSAVTEVARGGGAGSQIAV
eukprot:COSAG06_NODE_30997_length_528_cov_1.608392_1_plen_49_part_01